MGGGLQILSLNFEIFQASSHFCTKKKPLWLLPNNLFFPPLHSLLILPQTNVSSLADLWLWSRGVICEQLCQHHRLPIHVTVYRYVPGRRRAKDEQVGTEMGVRGKDRQNGEWKGEREASKKWGVGQSDAERRESLNRYCGMNIPILPCSLETAASSFGGKHCLCLFPAWLFAWCIPQLYIQWWEKDDVLAGWQWGLRGTEAGTVSFIQCKDQRPRFFTLN